MLNLLKICNPAEYVSAKLVRKIMQNFLKLVNITFKIGVKILGPTLLIFASLLIITISLLYIFYVLPTVCNNSIINYIFHLGFGLSVLFNIFFNYLACALIDAGSPPTDKDPGKYLGESVDTVDGKKTRRVNLALTVQPGVLYRYCRYCKSIKPPRAHHCSISGRCILEFDHYCPWIGRTVGYGNYRYFILFMSYLFVGCTYCLVTTTSIFLRMSEREKAMVLT
jgi:palmitoyltransferase